MTRPYATLDVFTDRAFGGNPLGLVADARGLDTDAMQTIAREFNYSETIFLLPPEDPANHVKARIFTPGGELPFAGHPNVGLGVWAAHAGEVFGKRIDDELRAEEGAGLVVLDLQRASVAGDASVAGNDVVTATLTAPTPFARGREFTPERVAATAGLDVASIRTDNHAPVHASVGATFAIAELASRRDLAAARPVAEAFDALDVEAGLVEALYYVRDGDAVAMRMFTPPHGIPEDPATGSAAGALVALLASLDPAPDVDLAFAITQGDEMGRPSRISAFAEKRGGVVGAVRVGGRAVIVMEGTLRV